MPEEDEPEISIVFNLEHYDYIDNKLVFKQQVEEDHEGIFHHWAMDVNDWNFIGRPVSFVMTISPLNLVDLDSDDSAGRLECKT